MNKERWKPVKHLYAFWRHDTYPFVLGAVVEAIDDRGRVMLGAYNRMIVEPIKVVERTLGLRLQKQLDLLRSHQQAALEAFHDEWRQKVVDTFGPELTKEAEYAARTRRDTECFYCEQCKTQATGACPVSGHVSQHIEHKGSGYWGPSKRPPVRREKDGSLSQKA
jgi:hypothetical protein